MYPSSAAFPSSHPLAPDPLTTVGPIDEPVDPAALRPLVTLSWVLLPDPVLRGIPLVEVEVEGGGVDCSWCVSRAMQVSMAGMYSTSPSSSNQSLGVQIRVRLRVIVKCWCYCYC